MDINTFCTTLLHHHFNMLLRLVPGFSPHFPPRPTAPSTDPEIAVGQQPTQIPPVIVRQNFEWSRLILSFCFTSAIEIAIQSTQTSAPLSPLFHALSLTISLAFASLLLAKCIDSSKFPVTANALERFSVFFAATTFFHAISIPFPVYIKCTTWAIYLLSVLIILICHLTT